MALSSTSIMCRSSIKILKQKHKINSNIIINSLTLYTTIYLRNIENLMKIKNLCTVQEYL